MKFELSKWYPHDGKQTPSIPTDAKVRALRRNGDVFEFRFNAPGLPLRRWGWKTDMQPDEIVSFCVLELPNTQPNKLAPITDKEIYDLIKDVKVERIGTTHSCIATIVLKNGWVVTGQSGCIVNFNQPLAELRAIKEAHTRIRELEAYRRLANANQQ